MLISQNQGMQVYITMLEPLGVLFKQVVDTRTKQDHYKGIK
jgi:hypothetical protein